MMPIMPPQGKFRASGRRPNIRVRQESSGSDSDGASGVIPSSRVVKKPRGFVQSTFKKREAQIEDDDARPFTGTYTSSRTGKSEAPIDMGATSIIEHDTQTDRDATALRLKNQEFEKQDTSTFPFLLGHNKQQGSLRYGPQRAPQNIRSTTRWDYAPDICKDYKETGSCGFGDSCKFLHDRSDYKFGWQIDKEDYSVPDDESKYLVEDDDTHPRVLDEPFECVNCAGNDFKELVRSRCEHLFCDSCFQYLSKERRCPACSFVMDGCGKFIQSSNYSKRTGIGVFTHGFS